MKYRNPIISGFHPDPSVCRVGDDYYLVTSSFEYFPGIPVYHSKDLVNWRQIGHCLNRSTQIELTKAAPNSMGIYAPTIRYHEGYFYVITTNITYGLAKGGNFVVRTNDPYEEWSDPVWIDLPGIDPSLFFGEDGKVYYTGAYKDIFMCEIDLNTGKVLSDPLSIWGGTGAVDPEGPHLYKIGDYYYLFISEGGTSQGHMITGARSKNIWGPYEPCPRNPVLSNRSMPLPIKATGHTDFIQAHDGSWWAVCLGIRPVPYPDRHHLGRETFLAPVKWDDDQWPIIGNDGTIDMEMEADCLPEFKFAERNVRDDFEDSRLDYCWNFIYNPDPKLWSLNDRQGFLTLKGNEISLDDKETSAWLGRRQEHMECSVRTLLEFEPKNDGEEAGLSIFLNCDHHYEIALTQLNGKKKIIFRRRIGSLWKVENCLDYESSSVLLQLDADSHTYSFSYSEGEGRATRSMGSGEVHYLSTEVGGRFTGIYIVLYATGNGMKNTEPAYFDWFDYQAIQQ